MKQQKTTKINKQTKQTKYACVFVVVVHYKTHLFMFTCCCFFSGGQHKCAEISMVMKLEDWGALNPTVAQPQPQVITFVCFILNLTTGLCEIKKQQSIFCKIKNNNQCFVK
jgi:hypothetical protein